MKCEVCGTENEKSWGKCENCGAELSPAKENSSNKKTMIFVTALIIIAIALISIIFVPQIISYNDDAHTAARNVINIVDNYIDCKITAEDAQKRISQISDSKFLSDDKNSHLRYCILNIELDFNSNDVDYDKLISDKNKLADEVNKII